jgi:lipopolysaccharide export system protein LptA
LITLPILKTAVKLSSRQVCFVIVLWVVSIGFANAAENQAPATSDADQPPPIQITADQLTADEKLSVAEFSGNVEAVQGAFVIKADQLKIYYTADQTQTTDAQSPSGAIEKIEAIGNVRIKAEEVKAQTAKAEYDARTMKLMLIGANSVISSGKNRISGSRITYFRADGKIKIEGDGRQRVSGTFYSDEDISSTGLEGRSD